MPKHRLRNLMSQHSSDHHVKINCQNRVKMGEQQMLQILQKEDWNKKKKMKKMKKKRMKKKKKKRKKKLKKK